MPIQLPALDPDLFRHPQHRPHTTPARRAAGAIGEALGESARLTLATLAHLLARLLFWPAVIALLGLPVTAVVFASIGMWLDAVESLFWTAVVAVSYGAVVRVGRRWGVHSVR